MPRILALLIFPGFQLLDAAGPLGAFEAANDCVPGSYRLDILSRDGGLVPSSGGARLLSTPLSAAEAPDTLLIAGGTGVDAAAECPATRAWVMHQAGVARRTASVCSGAWLLASAGLLDGRKATTHWGRGPSFSRRFPAVQLDADKIFVRDGPLWTSAGITAGIDLALALIADDLGEAVARQVARQLVVYYRRPGGQSQFSEMADMQPPGSPFANLLDHVRRHLDERLDVDQLAALACMSPRNFSRRFVQEVGVTPARAVERLRVEAAAAALESSQEAVLAVARRCGFGDGERMRRAFLRVLGVPPSARRRAGA
ncbi:GlxA family transcriptional regulator [Zoogloea sp.]|uniref:GlxA family transcriptional regulator n=1 Tax=Zoogloea sp. TaxID=49181 RepID=UPI0014156347|nr:MAG: GlxA family transcriptional regulator [Zoogloea sp.]